ncbi:MAG: HipA N-terminal domain-containing protein [Motiliproteus sp.]
MSRKAAIYYNGLLAGQLTEETDSFEFTYSAEYLAGGTPISFQLPLQEAAFTSPVLPAFFENLVSEGWLLKLQAQQQKIDKNDRFGLLLNNGADLVGAVTIQAIED